MIQTQKVPLEQDFMTLLLTYELSPQPSQYSKMERVEMLIERRIDTLIYKKYMQLAELQSMLMTMEQINKRDKELKVSDKDNMDYIEFIMAKETDLALCEN